MLQLYNNLQFLLKLCKKNLKQNINLFINFSASNVLDTSRIS